MGVLQLLIGVGGIYASFLYYGSLQEDVLTYKSASGEKFKYSWFLQVIEAMANVVLGGLCALIIEGGPRAVPQKPYLVSGAVQVSAKYLTTMAMVSGVSFPVATLGKSSKMVPVMIGQLLMGSAKYTVRQYIHVLLIVGGTAAVSMSGKSKPGAPSSAIGLGFLAAALACDGIVGGTQKAMKKAFADVGMKEKSFEMQFYTNLYMALTAVVFTFVMGEAQPGYKFLVENPAISQDIAKFAVCSAAGQAFIFFTISQFDSLVCTTVTTTRKVFSVLYSILMKGHQLNGQGWGGIAMACGGILGELEEKYSEGKKAAAEKTNKKTDGDASAKGADAKGDGQKKAKPNRSASPAPQKEEDNKSK